MKVHNSYKMQAPDSFSREPQKYHTQSNFHSLSGSETDVSTSSENLTAEERTALHCGIRQEPQGEETLSDDLDSVKSNTLIIHNNSSLDNYASPFYAQCSRHDNITKLSELSPAHLSKTQLGSPLYKLSGSNRNSLTKGSNVLSSPKSICRRSHLASILNTKNSSSLQKEHISSNVEQESDNVLLSDSKFDFPEQSVQEITEIPKHYLDQSEVLKHLAKEVHHHQVPGDLTKPSLLCTKYQVAESKFNLSRVRDVGQRINSITSKHSSSLSMSHSHPDLTNIDYGYREEQSKNEEFSKRPMTRGQQTIEASGEALQIIELLSTENAALKNELDLHYRKVAKLEKFELEIQKLHQAHEDLIKTSEKREQLEKAVRGWLEIEVKRLSDNNKELQEKLKVATSHLSKKPLYSVDDTELQKEIGKKEILISQILSQSKELLAEKERQEIELNAQRVTLQEQRNHIEILDSALTSAQANVVRLEEECLKKQAYVDRVSQLQKALANLQLASERRIRMEKKMRMDMKKEIDELKLVKRGISGTSRFKSTENGEEMRKTIREYEEKIISLEAEVTKWEQRYLEESTMRQIAVDAASVPKDAKIAALEKTSQESEKLIAQARSDKLKQMDELYAAQRKCAELEGRVRDLESKLAERDAMIKVLQQHSHEKDAVLQNAVLGRPTRHIRAASTMGLTSTNHSTTTGLTSHTVVPSSTANVVHQHSDSKNNSRDETRISPMGGGSSDIDLQTSQSSQIVNESLPSSKELEQLKALDSRLFNKDSIINALREEKEHNPEQFWRV